MKTRHTTKNLLAGAALLAMFGVTPLHAQMNAPAAQLVTVLNNALKADMNPMFMSQFEQNVAAQVMGRIQVGPPAMMLQQTVAAMMQLAQQYDQKRGDDNKRAALVLSLSACGMSGMEPNTVISVLKQAMAGCDQRGETWHRRGKFGALAGQIIASGGGGFPDPTMPVQFPAFGGGFGGFDSGFSGGGGFGGGGQSGGGRKCGVCGGTGTTVRHDVPTYGDTSQHYCAECGQTVSASHYHGTCRACGGKGYN